MDDRAEQLGYMGEDLFKTLCTKAKLTANKAKIDKFGWDFSVEFKEEIPNNVIHLHNSSPKCKVQVKATDKQDGFVSIKLSNLHHSATDLYPTFYFIVEYDKHDDEQKVFIVHIDKHKITEILRHIHIKQKEYGKNFQSHKRYKVLHYNESHELSEINGAALKESLHQHIGTNYSKYVTSKAAHLKSTGFESGNAQIQLSVDGKQGLENFIDNTLGLKSELNVRDIKITNMRFNILEKNPSFYQKNTIIKTKPLKPHDIKITFKEDTALNNLDFEGELYLPLIPNTSVEFSKIRIKAKLFEIVIQSNDNSISFTFSDILNPSMNLVLLRNYLELLRMLYSTIANKIIVQVTSSTIGAIDFSFEPEKINFVFEDELLAVETALNILTSFKLFNPIITSLRNIMELSQYTEQVNQILNPTAPTNFALTEIDFDKLDQSKQYAFVTKILTKIGEHILCVLLVFLFNDLKEYEKSGVLTTDSFIIEHKLTFHHSSYSETALIPFYKEIGLKYAKNHLTQINTKLSIDFD